MTNDNDPKPEKQVVFVQSDQLSTVRAIASTRSYIGPAFLSFALYWLGFGILGLVANLLYLNSANRTEKLTGVAPEGKSCLVILLITHLLLLIPCVCITASIILGVPVLGIIGLGSGG